VAHLQEEIEYTPPNPIRPMEQVYLGAMGWSYSFWPLYDNTATSDYLARYSEHFNSVEINSTFYRIPRILSVENWRTQTPPDFRFTLKIPQSISHSRALQYDPEKLDIFLDHIKPFNEKLGPLLLQLPPRLTPEHSDQLGGLLTQLQRHCTAVEFRHKEWFNETTYALLRDHNAALVYVEHPWQPSEEVETSDYTYVRLEGDRKKVDGEKGVTELDRSTDNMRWAEKITQQAARGRATYLYVSKYYSGYPPTDLEQIKTRLEALKEP
jgi:uncharacterized protein YecE (DUF72 family)